MIRTYEIFPVGDRWKLVLFEDGEDAGGGFGGSDDYDFLFDQGNEFVGCY